MVLNKRERTTAIVVGSLLALLALYYIAIGPFLAYRGTLEKQRAKLVKDKNYYNRTISEAKTADVTWKEYLSGTLKESPDEASLQASTAVGNLAAESRIQISTIRPDPAMADDKLAFVPQTVKFTGTGNFSSVSHLLNQLENPKFPVKVLSVGLTPKDKEGVDNLQVQLQIATVSYNRNALLPKAAARPAAAAAQ